MITRFDHAVIGVRDLSSAIRQYQTLGFDVHPGGQHVGLGTHNAIVRFGLDYLELISVYDEAAAAASGARGDAILNFLRKREGGLLGYALAITGIQQEAERWRSSPITAEPFAMQRRRPDGNLLQWHLLVPSHVAWRRPWPFFIHWDTPDEQRLSWEGPGEHANGVIRWDGVSVGVRDLEKIANLYRQQVGLQETGPVDEVPHLKARRACFRLGSACIDLLAPQDEGPVQQMLAEVGEGPFEITLVVKSLEQTRRYLVQQHIDLEPYPDEPELFLLPPRLALGTRLVLKEQQS